MKKIISMFLVCIMSAVCFSEVSPLEMEILFITITNQQAEIIYLTGAKTYYSNNYYQECSVSSNLMQEMIETEEECRRENRKTFWTAAGVVALTILAFIAGAYSN